MTQTEKQTGRSEHLQTVDRALQVLETLGGSSDGHTIVELSRITGINRTNLQRIVTTLQSRGFAERDAVTLHYRLGPTLLGLAAGSTPQAISNAARLAMRKLAADTEETVWLAVPRGSNVVCIAQIESEQLLRVVRPLGFSHPLFVGAAGLSILAFMSEEKVEALSQIWSLDASIGQRFDATAMNDRLDAIRKQGYAFTSDQIATGASGLCAPIYDGQGEIAGSIGIVGPSARSSRDLRAKRSAQVKKAAQLCSQNLKLLRR